MALFLKKTPVTTEAPLYRIGAEKTVLIIGLGNIGKEYDGTRHNIGFVCVDAFASANDFPGWVEKKDLHCLMTSTNIADARVILIKPTTYMNNSGEAAFSTQQFYKIHAHNILAVHDELDMPFGQVRVRVGGSSAGNNGIKSLQQHLDGEFTRVRIGIANEFSARADSADFVLGKFTAEEQAKLNNLTQEANALISEFIQGGSLPHDTRSFD